MKVIVGLSGGVDSSVAALLLLQKGYEVEGLFMKNWDEDDNDDYCSAEEDLKDAKSIAHLLGIKLHAVNFSTEYWQKVWEHFIAEHKKGRTPNPDILCNQKIKFKTFLDYAFSLGADKIATGHYADIVYKNSEYYLQLAKDSNKDQTYFLHLLNQYQLSHSLFPLAKYTKQEIRKIAHKYKFLNADKKDSTGICFIGERNFKVFLSKYIKPKKGNIIDKNGNIIGEHQGVMFYTIGQRKGLGIGGGYGDKQNTPWFVADKNIKDNTILAVQKESELLSHNHLTTEVLHHITQPFEYHKIYNARIRHRGELYPCKIHPNTQTSGFEVIFKHPIKAITPGQSIVFYDKNICMGGAIISHRKKI